MGLIEKLSRKLIAFYLGPIEQEYKEAIKKCNEVLNLISESQKKIAQNDKGYLIQGPVVFLGSIKDSNFKVTPILRPKIVLGQVKFSSLLGIEGEAHIIQGSHFEGYDCEEVDPAEKAALIAFLKEAKDSDH